MVHKARDSGQSETLVSADPDLGRVLKVQPAPGCPSRVQGDRLRQLQTDDHERGRADSTQRDDARSASYAERLARGEGTWQDTSLGHATSPELG